MDGQTVAEQALHKELYERSRDIVRVFNPRQTDFRFKFDSVWYKVPAKGYKDFERYLAEKYFHDITNLIIGEIAIRKGEELLKARETKGLDPFLDKYQENVQVWNYVPQVNNKKLLEQLASELIVGLVEQFGSELPPEETAKPPKASNIPVESEVFDSFSKKFVDDVDTGEVQPLVRPIIKSTLAKEVTDEGTG